MAGFVLSGHETQLAFLAGALNLPLDGVRLTRKETDLLRLLVQNADRCLHRDFLLQRIWAYKAGTRTRTLDVHIQRLRRKLGPAGARILTIVRAGYMWRTEGTVQGR